MMATWFQGTYEEFIKVNDEGWASGVRILHFLGGSFDRRRRQPRDRADQDDDLAARAGRGRDLRRGLHRPLLRFLREARRPLGPGAAPADLREGPARPGRPRRQARRSIRICSRAFPKATATSLICRARSATRSRPTCPASKARSSRRFTPGRALARGRGAVRRAAAVAQHTIRARLAKTPICSGLLSLMRAWHTLK